MKFKNIKKKMRNKIIYNETNKFLIILKIN